MDDLRAIRDRLGQLPDPTLLLERLFEYAPVGLQIYAADGHSLIVNRAFREIFGTEPPPDYNVFRDEVVERIGMLPSIHRAFAGETVRVGPFWYDPREIQHVRVENGRRVALDTVAFPLPDSTGAVTHVAMVFSDVTGEIATAEALRASEQRFRALVEHAVEGIALVDARGVIRYQSPAITRILGYTMDEDVDRPARTQIHPDDLGVLTDTVTGLAAKPNATERAQYRVRHKDGSWRWVESIITNLLGDPMIGAFVFNYRDITEAKRTAEEVQLLNASLERRVAERTGQLEAAVRELESFTYTVSHDLRAPLRTMSGFTSLLVERHAATLPDDARRYVRYVNEGTRQLGQLVDDLLAFSRVGRQALAKRRIDPAELAREALAILEPDIAGRDISFTIGDLPSCLADPSLLRQVLVNLLSNAIKYTRVRVAAVVEVGARHDGIEQVYFVRDNGIGFDMRYVDKLFGVFQRLHQPEEYEGTGVGLPIVQRIIERHGGRVWAEGTAGGGATFYWTLGEESA